MKHATFRADAILLLAAVLWGGAFVAQRVAMRHMGPLTFNGLRFALGTLVLIPVVRVRSGGPRGGPRRLHVLAGAVAGVVMFVAATLQQAGLIYTTAGKAGFITGLYVALVPILGLFVGQRTSAATWVGAGLAAIGLYFLSVVGTFRINPGDALVMGSAVVWAVQVLLIGIFAPRTDPLRLAFAQFAVVAVASLVAAAAFEQVTVAAVRASAWAILYGGVGSVAIAFTLQVVGQRDAPPGHAALVLSLETVFAGLAGYVLLDERFGPRELFGAALMFAGMMVSQVRRLMPESALVPTLACQGEQRGDGTASGNG